MADGPSKGTGLGCSARGWTQDRTRYTCADRALVSLPEKVLVPEDTDENERLAVRNGVSYRVLESQGQTVLAVSEMELSRNASRLLRGAPDARVVVLPGTVREVLDGAMTDNDRLVSVVLNNGLERLGEEVVQDRTGRRFAIPQEIFCSSSLREVVFPVTLREVTIAVFDDCESLRTVWVRDGCTASVCDAVDDRVQVLPPRDTVAWGRTLWDVRVLREIAIPDGVERIGTCWFWGCEVESVTVPASVREIGACAFCQCRKLRRLAFAGAGKVEASAGSASQESRLRTIGNGSFCRCSSLRDVELPEGLVEIGQNAFSESGLELFVAPKTLRAVHQGAFRLCQNLRKAVLNEGLETLGVDEYRLTGGWWCGVFQGSALEEIVLPSTLKRIQYQTFQDCERLKNVLLPDGLEAIGAECFRGSAIEEISLPSSVRTVFAGAFQNCRRLKRAELNEGLETLGEECGTCCKEVVGRVFADSRIESVRVPSTVKSIGARTFESCKNLRSVELPDGLERIGAEAFAGSGIESVVLPASTRTVCGRAFYGCKRLRRAVLNEGLEELGTDEEGCQGSAFEGSGLVCAKLPSSLKSVGARTFARCRNLYRVEFSEGTEALGKKLFWGSGLREAVLPGTLREVHSDAFRGCESLRTVRVRRGCTANVGELVDRYVGVQFE